MGCAGTLWATGEYLEIVVLFVEYGCTRQKKIPDQVRGTLFSIYILPSKFTPTVFFWHCFGETIVQLYEGAIVLHTFALWLPLCFFFPCRSSCKARIRAIFAFPRGYFLLGNTIQALHGIGCPE